MIKDKKKDKTYNKNIHIYIRRVRILDEYIYNFRYILFDKMA